MNRRTKDLAAQFLPATESNRAEAASLAAKVADLPSRLEPRAGQMAEGDSQAFRRLRLRDRLLRWLPWLITGSLVAVALLRIFYHDGNYSLTCLNAFTRYLYLPAYFCLAWAVWKRRRILAVTNLAIIALHLTLIAPDFRRDGRFDSAANPTTNTAANSPTIRIFFANVRG